MSYSVSRLSSSIITLDKCLSPANYLNITYLVISLAPPTSLSPFLLSLPPT